MDFRLAERVGRQIAGAIANAQLFTERNKAEEEQQLILQLQEALLKVKTLKAIPICSSCKRFVMTKVTGTNSNLIFTIILKQNSVMHLPGMLQKTLPDSMRRKIKKTNR
jgi:hypothetical protein